MQTFSQCIFKLLHKHKAETEAISKYASVFDHLQQCRSEDEAIEIIVNLVKRGNITENECKALSTLYDNAQNYQHALTKITLIFNRLSTCKNDDQIAFTFAEAVNVGEITESECEALCTLYTENQ